MTPFRRNNLFRVALFAALLCVLGPVGASAADQPDRVNFGRSDNVLDLKGFLSPYRAPGGTEADGSSWYIVQVSNDTVRPATRVLLAGQPPRAALSLLPRRARPSILAVASSDSGTVVETASAYGRRAWRVIVPPVSTVRIEGDRKSTRLNSSHANISYAVFCFEKKQRNRDI